MGARYAITFAGVGVTAQQDFFEVSPAAGKPCIVHALYLSQSSEVGDAQEEGLALLIKRGATVSGSGGSAATPAALNPSASAASMAAEVNNTTKANTGTIVTLHSDNWNVRVPFVYLPPPECRPEVGGGSRLTVELGTTPADSITISGTLIVEEVG